MTSESSTTPNTRQAHRAWMFRISNPLQEDLPDRFMNNCEFLTYQYEKSESGLLHHQGYLVLKANPSNKNGRSLKWMKDNIDRSAHFEPRRGTHQQAVDYCNKEVRPHIYPYWDDVGHQDTRVKGPWTFGAWSDTEGPKRGGAVNSSKILSIKRKIDQGTDEKELYNEHFGEMLRYGKAFDRYRMISSGQRNWMTKAMCLYGPTKTGKSMRARKVSDFHFADSVYYLQLDAGERVWWDGYTGQRCVVIEEFYGQMKVSYLLKLLDRYPFHVETKGSMVPFLAEMIIFTSNEHPRMWYGKGAAPGEPSKIPLEVLAALQRRFTGTQGTCIEMKELVDIKDDEPDMESLAAEMIAAAEAPTPPPSPVRRGAIDLTCDEDQADASDQTPPDAWQGGDDDHVSDHYADDDERDADGFTDDDYVERQIMRDAARMPPPKIARTDSTTFGIQRVVDKRIGNTPVQAKLAWKKTAPTTVDDDDDVDDKHSGRMLG